MPKKGSAWGAEEMGQSVRCLPHKLKDTRMKSWVLWYMTLTVVLESREKGVRVGDA